MHLYNLNTCDYKSTFLKSKLYLEFKQEIVARQWNMIITLQAIVSQYYVFMTE